LLEKLGEVIEPREKPSGDDAEECPTAADTNVRRKIATLDQNHVYVAEDMQNPALRGLRLPAGGFVTSALILKAPEDAAPGDRFAFHVIQRRRGSIMGGSSYIFAVAKKPKSGSPRRRLTK
jgi:hypothetical protein